MEYSAGHWTSVHIVHNNSELLKVIFVQLNQPFQWYFLISNSTTQSYIELHEKLLLQKVACESLVEQSIF